MATRKRHKLPRDAPEEALPKRKRGRPLKAKFAEDTWSVAAPKIAGEPTCGVLLLAPEEPALEALQAFGEPDFSVRREPQQLLAVPCPMARPVVVRAAADMVIDERLRDLARRLRPERAAEAASLRGELLRLALDHLGCDHWRLREHCVMATLSLPCGKEEIAAATTVRERFVCEELRTRMDLGVTASSAPLPGESKEATALRALRDQCRLYVHEIFWQQEVQLQTRRELGVGLPLSFTDVLGSHVFVLLLPDEVHTSERSGLLRITASPEMDAPPLCQGILPATPGPGVVSASAVDAAPVTQEGWFCFTSRTTGEAYFWNEITSESSFKPPWTLLPEGWNYQVCSATGRVLFFHPVFGIRARLP